jgi:hypothetical protein
MKKRMSCLSGPFFPAFSHHFFSRRSMRAQTLTITTKLNTCVCLRVYIHIDSFPFLAAIALRARSDDRREKEEERIGKKEQEHRQPTIIRGTIVRFFFSRSSSCSELSIRCINHRHYCCALCLLTVIYICMIGKCSTQIHSCLE